MTLFRHSSIPRAALVVAAFAVLVAPRAASASTPSRADALRAAHAVERYYASYGPVAPIPPPVAAVAPPPRRSAPAPAAAPLTRGGPGWNAAVAAGALLFAVGAALGVLAGRDSMRPRRT